MEAQTKDLKCEFEEFKKGDFVHEKYNYLEAFTSCDFCKKAFWVNVKLENGVVNGKYSFPNTL